MNTTKNTNDRLEAAARAAIIRAERRYGHAIETDLDILESEEFPPSPDCTVCGQGLADRESIIRGVDPDCWRLVLSARNDRLEEVEPATATVRDAK